MPRSQKKNKQVEALKHEEAKRLNIPTAELQSVMEAEDREARELRYPRNTDLDPQLVWRGKDEQDWSDLVVHAPPLYIQEKLHPKVLIDDLIRESQARGEKDAEQETADLFADFNGLADPEAATEFYAHAQNWSNRMILGDALQVMASLAEREGLRGQVQCIYLDPPYGIKFNSNFQWSTTSRDVKDGAKDHITREPEQVRAFRDTWRDGIHSYLTYLRDRLTVARDLLHESGSIFVQIGDENIHRVRALMEEVFGEQNFVSQIQLKKSGGATSEYLAGVTDFVVWFSKNHERLKYRSIFLPRESEGKGGGYNLLAFQDGTWRQATASELSLGLQNRDSRLMQLITLTSQRQGRDTSAGSAMGFTIDFHGQSYTPARNRGWTTTQFGIGRLVKSDRIGRSGSNLRYKRYFDDFSVFPTNNFWEDMQTGAGMEKIYVVQTSERVVQRCILMATDPGDLVLDPTCGSGTTAFAAERWGRRWITIDTSRVSLALARSRIMGARYPYYLLADSPEGLQKEGEITGTPPKERETRGDIRQGFVYERVPHITLKSIANNAEIDVIWDKWQETLEPLRDTLNVALGKTWEEWEIPREAEEAWPAKAKDAHAKWWEARIARQQEIDASIAAKAEQEYLYDRPYVDTSRVRVAGPFTVESLSPHRVLAVDEHDELVDVAEAAEGKRGGTSYESEADFAQMVMEQLAAAGVQQAHKEDRIAFSSVKGWPGELIGAEGLYQEGEEGPARRAAIFIGPEYGTVSRPDLVQAAREAADCDFDVLVACAFNFDAHSSELEKLGRIPVLKARMNPDLHMADDLKATASGNLFVVFGEPDIEVLPRDDDQLQIKINGVDVFRPGTGEITSEGPEGIALWMIDTDYNEESFFVRHAYFLGANDPYKALKTTLKAEIDKEAWETLHSDTSRSFPKPTTGRIAVKVINHLGDEVMKVFGV
ncbi:MAG: site-specific DNA-methyltransferase [Rhodovibrionaceae bacterium]